MVEQKICSFCGGNIEPGTGRLYVRKDGMTYNFCSSKCFKNLVVMKRLPRETEWTAAYKREKDTRMTPAIQEGDGAEAKSGAKKVRKVVRPVAAPKAPAEAEQKAPETKSEGEKQ
jgi:large subunit ribosomal protein L24e